MATPRSPAADGTPRASKATVAAEEVANVYNAALKAEIAQLKADSAFEAKAAAAGETKIDQLETKIATRPA